MLNGCSEAMAEFQPGNFFYTNRRGDFVDVNRKIISEYHIKEIYFLVPPDPFQSFKLVPFVKRWPCLAFLYGSSFA